VVPIFPEVQLGLCDLIVEIAPNYIVKSYVNRLKKHMNLESRFDININLLRCEVEGQLVKKLIGDNGSV
jgi:predicted RNA-binding protein Jag